MIGARQGRIARAAFGRLYGQAYVLLGIATLVAGGNAVAARLAVGEISPLALTCLRWAFPVVILGVALRRELKTDLPILAERWRSILVLGGVGFTLVNALYYWGAHFTTAVNITILQGSTPPIVFFGTLLVYGTRIRPMQIVGMLTALVGIGVIAVKGQLETLLHLTFNLGDLMELLSFALYAGFIVAMNDRPRVPVLVFFAAMAAAAFVSSVPLIIYEAAAGTLQWPSWKGWILLVYTGLLPSFMAQVFFMRAVDLIGPGRVGLSVNLVPVFGTLLAVIILGEPLHIHQGVALLLVLSGIWLAELGKRVEPIARRS